MSFPRYFAHIKAHIVSDPKNGWICPTCTLLNDPTRPGCAACTSERPADYKVPEPGPADTIKKPTLAAVGGKQAAAATQASKPVAAASTQAVKTPTPLAVKPAAGGAIAKAAVVDVKAVADNGAASKVVKKVDMILLKSDLDKIKATSQLGSAVDSIYSQ